MRASEVTQESLTDLVLVERVSSGLGLLGCALVAVTFLGSTAFQKPINRLIFYASMGNVFTNIATFISRDAQRNPNGALCQTQSFLIQMFMAADALWTFVMACNVWLTFYHKYDAKRLRQLEKWYLLVCYGIPFVPALVFVFITTPSKGHIYGNATLWCWVSREWETLRIACFYGPVWLIILATLFIYIRAGKDIFMKRRELRSFNIPPSEPMAILADPFTSQKTTEVYVTSETISSSDTIGPQQLSPRDQTPGAPASGISPIQGYKASITSHTDEQASERWAYNNKSTTFEGKNSGRDSTTPSTIAIPHERNSIYDPSRKYAANEASNAAWSYTKVAMLFFLAMMVTWIPSSANRVYSVVHQGELSLTLQFASAFVLPLQGFWNAAIYFTTSFSACKKLWGQVRDGKRMSAGGGIKTMVAAFNDDRARESWQSRRITMSKGGRDEFDLDTESTTELHSRLNTRESGSGPGSV